MLDVVKKTTGKNNVGRNNEDFFGKMCAKGNYRKGEQIFKIQNLKSLAGVHSPGEKMFTLAVVTFSH